MKPSRVLFLSLLALVASVAHAAALGVRDPAAAGFDAEKLARIRPAMERHVAEGRLVGGVGVVARDGKVVWAEAWGHRDRENGRPMTLDTIFRIYSMSKPITSVAAMMLVEQGRLDLDAPLGRYLPELARMKVLVETQDEAGRPRFTEVPAQRPVTVRDLLRHTAGFTYGFFGDTEVDRRYRQAGVLVTDRTLADTVRKLAGIPLLYQPGTRWHYSVSVDVLGRVVEVVSGRSLSRFLQENVFGPLGMEDTFFVVPKAKQPRLARLYTPDGRGGLRPAPPWRSRGFLDPGNRFYSGGGGLCSTAADYLAFCRMLLNEGHLGRVRLLRPETVRQMHTNQLGPEVKRPPGFRFGLGFRIERDGTYGWGGAAGTRFWIDPRNRLVILYMVQIMPTGRFDFSGEMRRLVYAAMR